MSWRMCLVAAFAALLAFYAGWWLRTQRAIDACLDAGGRWEASLGYCIDAVYGPPRAQASRPTRGTALRAGPDRRAMG